jgi:hypothetical protein
MADIVKQLFENNKLEILKQDIKIFSDKIKNSLRKNSSIIYNEICEEHAARIIQQAIRSKKIKETILTSPYFSYLSMIDVDDEQLQLSAIMFGRHVAELRIGSRERFDNPLINIREYYTTIK